MIAAAKKKEVKPALNGQGLLRCLYVHLKAAGTMTVQREMLAELQNPMITSEYIGSLDAYRVYVKKKKKIKRRGIVKPRKKLFLPS